MFYHKFFPSGVTSNGTVCPHEDVPIDELHT